MPFLIGLSNLREVMPTVAGQANTQVQVSENPFERSEMKKIIAIVLAVVLVGGGFGGFAYAQSQHELMTGQKLIGLGGHGTVDIPGAHLFFTSHFSITNPDCVSEITIKRISIIREDGMLIYEGPLLRQEVVGVEVVESIPLTEPMKPHQREIVAVQYYFPDPDDPDHEWMNRDEANALPADAYTLEIFWTKSHRRGLPLIGWSDQMKFKRLLPDGEYMESGYRAQMVNMRQELKP